MQELNLEELKRLGRVEVEVKDNEVIISLKKADKDDTGEWELSLTNSAGTEKAQFDLVVKCPPGPPESESRAPSIVPVIHQLRLIEIALSNLALCSVLPFLRTILPTRA